MCANEGLFQDPVVQRRFCSGGTEYRVTLAPQEGPRGISSWKKSLVFETETAWVGALSVFQEFPLDRIPDGELKRLLVEVAGRR